MRNIELKPLPLSSWRKIALGTWNKGGDPSVYGVLEVNAEKILARQKSWTARTGEKAPTLTAVVAKATAMTLHKYPQMNALVRFGRIYNRKNVALFLQTAVDDAGKDLSGVVIPEAEDKSLQQILNELQAKSKAIREDKDPNFKQAKNTFSLVPITLVKYVLNFLSFMLYTLNIDMRWAGLPKDPFGSVMITSIGSIGLEEAFAPLVPYSRVPLLLAVGALRDKPTVLDGKVVVAPLFKICVTFDHRIIDGLYAAKMVKMFRGLLETDEGLDQVGLK